MIQAEEIIKVFEKGNRKLKYFNYIFVFAIIQQSQINFTQEPTKKDNYVYNILRDKLNVHNTVENFRKIEA